MSSDFYASIVGSSSVKNGKKVVEQRGTHLV